MRVVVALGGNALLRRGQELSADNQRQNARAACQALAPLALEHELVVSHGNGPQVGLLALQGSAYTAVDTGEGSRVAEELAHRWEADLETGRTLDPGPLPVDDLRDVLNAAWWCRLRRPDDAAAIEAAALAAGRRILDVPRSRPMPSVPR